MGKAAAKCTYAFAQDFMVEEAENISLRTLLHVFAFIVIIIMPSLFVCMYVARVKAFNVVTTVCWCVHEYLLA